MVLWSKLGEWKCSCECWEPMRRTGSSLAESTLFLSLRGCSPQTCCSQRQGSPGPNWRKNSGTLETPDAGLNSPSHPSSLRESQQ